MANPTWPSDLPQRFLIDGYSEKLRDGRLLSKTSAGPGKARRRFSSAVMVVSASIRLTYTQKSRFERFWYDDTKNGVLPFVLPDQTHDGLPLLDAAGNALLDAAGNPLLTSAKWLAVFGQDAPTLTPWGLQFTASFPLNIMP